jgi:hypothetical protein
LVDVGVGFSTGREEGFEGCERNGKPGRDGRSGTVPVLTFDGGFILLLLLLLKLLFIGKSGTKPLDAPRNEVPGMFEESDRGVTGVPYAFRFEVISSD